MEFDGWGFFPEFYLDKKFNDLEERQKKCQENQTIEQVFFLLRIISPIDIGKFEILIKPQNDEASKIEPKYTEVENR